MISRQRHDRRIQHSGKMSPYYASLNNGVAVAISGYAKINIWDTSGIAQWAVPLGGGTSNFTYTFTYTAVPEPSTWVMAGVFGMGAVVTVGMRRRQKANV